MEVIRNILNYRCKGKSAVTIGTFDGIHIGHQKIIEKVVQIETMTSTVLTFFPHPKVVLHGKDAVEQIQTIREREKAIEKLAVERLVIQHFSKEFANMDAEDYVREILVERLNAAKVIVGYDHRFGKQGKAGIEQMRDFGQKYEFEVEEISAQEIENVRVSSTKIRQAILQGKIAEANKYLGHPFTLTGVVTKGMKLGRKIGFPTANIKIEEDYKIMPKNGVYAVWSTIEKEKKYGMMSVGENPTIEGKGKSIEVNFFDFDEDLYGKEIEINLVEYTREQKKFENIEQLKDRLVQDEIQIRQIFSR